MTTCLMIETTDNRKFFTFCENEKQLTEFANNFGASLYLVKAANAPVLELKQLATAISSTTVPEPVDYQIITTKVQHEKTKKRRNVDRERKELNQYITDLFVSGHPVRLTDINQTFKHWNMPPVFFWKEVESAKNKLTKQGFKIEKIKRGEHRLLMPDEVRKQ